MSTAAMSVWSATAGMSSPCRHTGLKPTNKQQQQMARLHLLEHRVGLGFCSFRFVLFFRSFAFSFIAHLLRPFISTNDNWLFFFLIIFRCSFSGSRPSEGGTKKKTKQTKKQNKTKQTKTGHNQFIRLFIFGVLFSFFFFYPCLCWKYRRIIDANKRDVFSAWVAASPTAPPGYPPPVK